MRSVVLALLLAAAGCTSNADRARQLVAEAEHLAPAEAEPKLAEAARLDRDDDEAAWKLAVARAALGRHPEAVRAAARAVTLQPRRTAYLITAGQEYLACRRWREARETFER